MRRRDYVECVVDRFAHQIQSEYYGGNMYVSIEVIALEHFNETYQETSSSYSHLGAHVMLCFTRFCKNNMKQHAATTAAHSKLIIDMLKTEMFRCWSQ